MAAVARLYREIINSRTVNGRLTMRTSPNQAYNAGPTVRAYCVAPTIQNSPVDCNPTDRSWELRTSSDPLMYSFVVLPSFTRATWNQVKVGVRKLQSVTR